MTTLSKVRRGLFVLRPARFNEHEKRPHSSSEFMRILLDWSSHERRAAQLGAPADAAGTPRYRAASWRVVRGREAPAINSLERTPLRGCAPMTRAQDVVLSTRQGVPLSSRHVGRQSKRNLLASKYASVFSMAIHLRYSFSATAPVVLEPANGSSTMSPSSVTNLIKNSGNADGKRAG